MAVFVAVLYSRAVDSTVPASGLSTAYSINILSRLNLIVPLVITVLRGVYALILLQVHLLTVYF